MMTSQQTMQQTFVMRVDAVDRVKLWIDGVVQLHFAHPNDPFDDVLNEYFFRHAAGRHYVQGRQCGVEC